MAHFPLITLSGTAAERGQQYGEAASEKIRINIDFYTSLFQAYGVSWEKARVVAKSFEPCIRDYLPWAIEEMRAIAQSCGISYEDILTINCRSEVLFAQPDGCSAFGVLPELTENGHTLLGQTWDWLAGSRAAAVVLKVKSPTEPDAIICAEAGMIGGKGLNAHGIGVCLNALSVGHGTIGVPLHIMYRKILGQDTISNALDQIAKPQRAGSGCFVLGSASGFLMSVEFTPENFDVLMPISEPLCHTNHYLSPILRGADTFKRDLTDTFVRLNRLQRLCRAFNSRYTVAKVFEYLSDHANFPDSVCSHEDLADPEGKRLCTVYAMAMDLNEKSLWITSDNPCCSDRQKISL